MAYPYRMKSCYFCRKKIDQIDFKDVALLSRYLTLWSKIKGSKESGVCSKHQRILTKAIKRARFLAILPYTSR